MKPFLLLFFAAVMLPLQSQNSYGEPSGQTMKFITGDTSLLAGDLVINEFMASNDTTRADQDGDFDDWIELYNNSTETIFLDGFTLSDDPEEPAKWTFPTGTSIAGNSYLIIWADEELDQEGLHADFKLSAGGESIVLIDANFGIVDSLTYPDQETDISYGRFPNGTGEFATMSPTFNAENVEGIADTMDNELMLSPLAGDLAVNEFMASNDTTQADQDGDFDDWIELYNNTPESLQLDGFFLTDDLEDLTKWTFPTGTSIAGNGYLITWADEDLDQEGLHADFKLSAGGEMVVLVDADGKLVDTLSYGEQSTDVSHGRFPNGTGDFVDMTPTFDAENSNGSVSTDNEALVGAELTLFPNPTNGLLNIQLEQSYTGDLQITLFGTDGRSLLEAVLSRGSTTLLIDTKGLAKGVYLLTVMDGRALNSYRVVVL